MLILSFETVVAPSAVAGRMTFDEVSVPSVAVASVALVCGMTLRAASLPPQSGPSFHRD